MDKLSHRQRMWAERERSGNGAERPENGVERSGAERWAGVGEKRWSGAEREVVERERSVERVELAAHSPLQRNISLIS